jgi:hypothetical protein
MCACHAARPNLAADSRQQLASLGARTMTSSPTAHERLARLEDQRLDLLAAHAQHRRDLSLRLVTQLKEHQRRALVGGQPLDVLQQLT